MPWRTSRSRSLEPEHRMPGGLGREFLESGILVHVEVGTNCQSPRSVETVLCHFGPELGCWCSPLLCHPMFECDRRESVVGGVPAGGVVEVGDPG
jgi:hypothetical protein